MRATELRECSDGSTHCSTCNEASHGIAPCQPDAEDYEGRTARLCEAAGDKSGPVGEADLLFEVLAPFAQERAAAVGDRRRDREVNKSTKGRLHCCKWQGRQYGLGRHQW